MKSLSLSELIISKLPKIALPLFLLSTLINTVIAQETEAKYSLQPVEIIVSGHRPGPRLWKVSHDDNVLWIFAFLSPLPSGMKWESARVEEILSQSQEYLPMLQVNANVSVPKEIRQLPNKQKLEDILPPDLYEQYRELKREYFRFNRGIEKMSPVYAAGILNALTFKKNDLDSGTGILRKIDKLARRNRALVRTAIIQTPSKDLRDEIQARYTERLTKITQEEGITCFATRLERVKPDIEILRQQANAWATGDIGELVYLNGVLQNRSNPCKFSMALEAFSEEFTEFITAAGAKRLASFENALQNNSSTFAVINLNDLLNEDGILNALREKGYEVQAPK